MTATPTVLVVEDDPLSRAVLTDMLRADGYNVLAVETAEQGLAAAEQRDIHVFLSDIELPGMNGIDLCRRVKAMERFRLSPFLIMTGLQDDLFLQAAFEAGCDDFISKPPTPVVLKARLKSQVQRMEFVGHLQRSRRTLQRFVSSRTSELVEMHSDSAQLPPPEEREVTICFTDIRSFTEKSQNVPPKTLFSLLSEHLADQVRLVYEHGGYIDKFGGDGVMAIFDGTDMARSSCACALAILRAAESGSSPIRHLGIGIHMGRAVIGNIGFSEHMDYSVVGASVNLAARLCGCATPMSIVVSRAIRNAVEGAPEFHFTAERMVQIRGFNEPITICNLEPG